MLCSIYGQKFHAIMYGGVSYKDHYFDVGGSQHSAFTPNDHSKSRSNPNQTISNMLHSSIRNDRMTNKNSDSNAGS